MSERSMPDLLPDNMKDAPLDERFNFVVGRLSDALESIFRHQDNIERLLEGNGHQSYKEVRSYVGDLKKAKALPMVTTVSDLLEAGVWRLMHWGSARMRMEWLIVPAVLIALVLAVIGL